MREVKYPFSGKRTRRFSFFRDESAETLALASGAGFRCFTSGEDFRKYVLKEMGKEEEG
ncbi:MAG: hypothetical protein IPK21_09495 [Haliscomenobacter sp.]|nr:hypothetical protein [Haliscomenobacter sp.]